MARGPRLRPLLVAGWTVADVEYALDHARDGTARTWTTPGRHPAGWLRFRLAAWVDAAGVPLPAPMSTATAAHRDRASPGGRGRDREVPLTDCHVR